MEAYASLEQISTVLNCTPRWINRLVKEKGFPRASRGQYDIVKCVHWYIADLQKQIDEERKGTNKKDYEAEREKYKALREKFEFERDVIGSAISVDDHQARLEKIVVHINTKLEIIPSKAAVKFDLPQHVKKGLKELVDEIKNELSDYDKYRLRLENSSGSSVKSSRGGKKNAKPVRAKKKTGAKRVGK